MKISLIIPTYNRIDILRMCLEPLEEQNFSMKDFEVLVVNDGSTDDTEDFLNRFASETKLNFHFFTQSNSGQGIARNLGLKHANGEIVIFLGDDIIPVPEFLNEHWKSHQAHPEQNSAVLGFVDWHPDLEVNSFMKWMVNGSSIFGKFGGHQFAYEKLERGENPDYNFFYTCNLSLKRSFLGKNPFDDRFSKYGWEDIELGYRLQKEKSLKMIYNPAALAYHHHAMDESGLARRMEMIGRSAYIIDEKHPELHKVPPFWKRFVFFVLSNSISLLLIRFLNFLSRGHFQPLYYYALSKKYFLIGLRAGKLSKNSL